MKVTWRTAWQGQDIVVFRDEVELDRLPAQQIRRVVFIYRDSGDNPGDVVGALVRLEAEWLLFPAETGFAGRVHFERQAFWAERACIYWVAEGRASLPFALRRGRWFLRAAEPVFARVAADQLDAVVERWPIEGPQTWEERKWQRIEANRPFAGLRPGDRLRA